MEENKLISPKLEDTAEENLENSFQLKNMSLTEVTKYKTKK